MKIATKFLIAPAALAFGFAAVATTPAFAEDSGETTYMAQLDALNGSGGTGSYTVMVEGMTATVTGEVSGLAEVFNDAPYPHAQHIHIGAEGVCPPAEADENGDGVIDTPEGQPFYGEIGTSITVSGDTGVDSALALDRFPSGGSFVYERTFDLNEETMEALKNGTAVVVVHGLDPATLSEEAQEKMSSLDPELPLAATAPALCGPLMASQVDGTPDGGAGTGAGGTAGPDLGLLALGGGLLLAAGGAIAVRRNMGRA